MIVYRRRRISLKPPHNRNPNGSDDRYPELPFCERPRLKSTAHISFFESDTSCQCHYREVGCKSAIIRLACVFTLLRGKLL